MQPHPRYQPLEKIASGSFASVYRGKDSELGREVAIKQIHDQFLSDSQQLERYWAEAQLLASYPHPNIVTIYDIVRDRGWLILELMQTDLSKVAGKRPMDLGALRTTLAHCLRALKYLHAHGIVHGDIKPSNMMVDRRRRVKIGDFGLARRVSDEEGSLIKGTTKYMAPEVVSDDFGEVGPASDLYSLGFAAYELLCGENFESLFPGLNAYGRDRQMAWMMWHAAPDRRLPEISRVLENVPPDLAKTIQKLVAKPQNERYQTADQALSDLKVDIKLVGGAEESSATLKRPAKGAPDGMRRLMLITAFAASALMSGAMLFWPSGGGQPVQSTSEGALTGVVKNIVLDRGAVVLFLEDGGAKEVPLGKDPKIRLEDGEKTYITLSDLQPDDRLSITFTPSGDGQRATVAVRRPVESTGRVKQLDPEGRKLLVAVDADPRPQDVPMLVAGAARVLLNGKPAEVADLAPDDRVEITHLVSDEEDAPRSIIRLAARRPQSGLGFVAEIVRKDDIRTLAVDKLGIIENIPVGADCSVKIDGSEGGDTPYTADDLKPDDRVQYIYDTHVRAVEATRTPRATGKMMKVDLGSRDLVVRSDDGSEKTYWVDEQCPLLLEGKPTTLDALQQFDHVDLTYEPRSGTSPRALTIDARRPIRR